MGFGFRRGLLVLQVLAVSPIGEKVGTLIRKIAITTLRQI
jgi:hypothetical protein